MPYIVAVQKLKSLKAQQPAAGDAAATGQTTKRATVEEALRTVVRLHQQRRAVERSAGLGWEGNLEESRAGR